MNKNKLQSGQVVILLAISMVVLLGFTALAIDGSLLYSDRRQLQTAADAAALAGAGAAGNYLAENNIKSGDWVCDGSVIPARTAAVNQAIIVAGTNGSAITFGTGENTVHTECVGSFLDYGPKYIDVIVTITEETQTSLVHFVYQGEAKNTVRAVTRVFASSTVGMGNSLISLTHDCSGTDKGTKFSGGGSGDTYILLTGGGSFSNSCLRAEGTSLTVDAGEDGSILFNTVYYEQGSPTVIPYPEQTDVKMEIIIPPPNCTNDPYMSMPNNPTNLSPGNYQGITVTNSDLVMQPGLYCLTGSFSISGGTVFGDGVTIYLKSGGYSVTGNPTVTLTAPELGCEFTPPANGCPPAIGGLLIYLDPTNSSGVDIEGSGESYYSGTVYAPNSLIKIGGTSTTTDFEAAVQAIGDSIHVHGNATLNITYNEDLLYHSPTRLDLFK
jgi:Flp pilus assembly protein TadG